MPDSKKLKGIRSNLILIELEDKMIKRTNNNYLLLNLVLKIK